ncbi:glycosyl transferase [Luteibacter rhizovicinus DSM 16549]|uniref:Glycosyl transferase n=1 Tax=Luteibacter rhizovicinus DSM 16549 TaxID=1440763 RepID=A0A0G9HET6_9GAMM|nr:glycosyltransferase family 2 protein [Luteibacter rhizovicinus]APG02646.1 glycosyl transferase [Luteibacter rhizovicinus DSM 16549]KLD68305.1 glycosyl transferase [Luteibacter rhizovicinus DSM 16549]KLD74636.1 glycosyl transferase [Xanthomonas hyacinthi DSM 19077]
MAGSPGPRDTAARPFAPCAVVPIYNHGRTIAATANALAGHGLPVLIVDDGSNAETRAILDTLVNGRDDLHLIRLVANGGKGAALSAGFMAAFDAGYSHVLQIDADGQHDTADVPRFLAEAKAAPDAMVCGRPIYDDSVPRARLYGRYLTHVCVWAETLSFAIQDSMCGYRLYPLDATRAEIARKPLPTRMDFDTEIAVRLFWRGVPVRNLPTRVIYPEDGLSHFRMWRDNARITVMHTRLLLGMLPRAPGLLFRKLQNRAP